MSEEDPSCTVCIEKFTKQPHKKQACCLYCNVKACVTCTQTYLISTHEDAHCMECRRGWTREVMDGILLTTWINGPYKLHRQNILLDRERSRLPAAQLFLENIKKGQLLIPQRKLINDEINQLELRIQTLRMEYYRLNTRIETYNRGIEPAQTLNIATTTATAQEKEKRVFIMPCPASSCRGFLSSAYKCGICDIYCCPDCHEIKGLNRDAPHTCDANTVATVRAIKKECRNCPDCGTSIFKLEGCNMMYCTNCNTPFDWVSGKKVTHGTIHNPHYFEYLRATNGGHMPRNPGDIPCAGNIPTAWTFDREVQRRYPHLAHSVTDWLYRALNVITHIQHVEIPSVTNQAEDTDNMQYNVRYLSKDITDVRWKQILAQREKRRIKRDEIRLRYEAFVGACADIYGRMMIVAREGTHERDVVLTRGQTSGASIAKMKKEEMSAVCAEAKEQLLTLRKIFNEGMMDISKRYKCQVMQLGDTALKRETKKYETGRAPRRVKRTDGDTVASSSDEDVEDNDTDSVVQEFANHQNVLIRKDI